MARNAGKLGKFDVEKMCPTCRSESRSGAFLNDIYDMTVNIRERECIRRMKSITSWSIIYSECRLPGFLEGHTTILCVGVCVCVCVLMLRCFQVLQKLLIKYNGTGKRMVITFELLLMKFGK